MPLDVHPGASENLWLVGNRAGKFWLGDSGKNAKGWDEGMKSGKERGQERMGPNTYHLLCLHTNGNEVSALPFMCKELRGKTETHCSYFFLSQAH